MQNLHSIQAMVKVEGWRRGFDFWVKKYEDTASLSSAYNFVEKNQITAGRP